MLHTNYVLYTLLYIYTHLYIYIYLSLYCTEHVYMYMSICIDIYIFCTCLSANIVYLIGYILHVLSDMVRMLYIIYYRLYIACYMPCTTCSILHAKHLGSHGHCRSAPAPLHAGGSSRRCQPRALLADHVVGLHLPPSSVPSTQI